MGRTIGIAILGAALLFPASAEEPKKVPEKRDASAEREAETERSGKARSGDDAPVVFDNEALAARYGDDAAPVSAVSGGLAGPATADALEPAEPLPDALQAIEDEKARRRSREIIAKRLDAEIDRLETRVDGLEKRILAIRNPFLPRPVIPEAEALEWSQLTAPQRVARTEEQIAETRRQLEATRERRERLAANP